MPQDRGDIEAGDCKHKFVVESKDAQTLKNEPKIKETDLHEDSFSMMLVIVEARQWSMVLRPSGGMSPNFSLIHFCVITSKDILRYLQSVCN